MSPSPVPPSPIQGGPAALEWRVHLAAASPGRTLLLGLLIAAVAWYGADRLSLLHAGAAAALLIFSMAEFLFPVRYRLTQEKASAHGIGFIREIEWREVKRLAIGKDEIKLLPGAAAGWSDAYRGLVLRCPAARERVLEKVRELIDASRRD